VEANPECILIRLLHPQKLPGSGYFGTKRRRRRRRRIGWIICKSIEPIPNRFSFILSQRLPKSQQYYYYYYTVVSIATLLSMQPTRGSKTAK
jgi:hypothetical protein